MVLLFLEKRLYKIRTNLKGLNKIRRLNKIQKGKLKEIYKINIRQTMKNRKKKIIKKAKI